MERASVATIQLLTGDRDVCMRGASGKSGFAFFACMLEHTRESGEGKLDGTGDGVWAVDM